MAFERDYLQRFREDGRNALLTYHRTVKQANQDMVKILNGIIQLEGRRPTDERFVQYFTVLSKQEEVALNRLIAPPDKVDHEVLNVPPHVAALVFQAYAAVNAAKADGIRAGAPHDIVEKSDQLTKKLEDLAQKASESESRVAVPNGLINFAYDSIMGDTTS